MEKIKILALFGKSGAGKDTVQKYIVKKIPSLFNGIVSCTTRPQREFEYNGKDYHFISLMRCIDFYNDDTFQAFIKCETNGVTPSQS